MPKRENTHIGMYLSTGVRPAQESLDSARSNIDIVLGREVGTSTVCRLALVMYRGGIESGAAEIDDRTRLEVLLGKRTRGLAVTIS
jgi:hypothetical protein